MDDKVLSARISLAAELAFPLAITICFTWVYNSTGGSLLLVSLLHAGLNAAAAISMELVGEEGFARQSPLVTLLFFLVAVVLVLAYGPTRLARGRGEK